MRPFLLSCTHVVFTLSALIVLSCSTAKQRGIDQEALLTPGATVDIDSIMLAIDKCKTCTRQEKSDTTFQTTEGTSIFADLNTQNEIIRLQVTHYGEMGRATTVFLVWRDSSYIQLNILDTYTKPFYAEGMIVKSDTVIVNCSIQPYQCNDDLFKYAKAYFD